MKQKIFMQIEYYWQSDFLKVIEDLRRLKGPLRRKAYAPIETSHDS